jgi:hypothetical protein
VVESVTADGAWVALSPSLRGRLASLDASSSAAEASRFGSRFAPGAVLACRVLTVDAAKRHVDLSTRASGDDDEAALARAGATFPGRVVRVVPAVGLYVQLPAHRSGRVALTGARPPPQRARSFVCCCVHAQSCQIGGAWLCGCFRFRCEVSHEARSYSHCDDDTIPLSESSTHSAAATTHACRCSARFSQSVQLSVSGVALVYVFAVRMKIVQSLSYYP